MGMVTVINRSNRPAPRLRATWSSAGSAASNARRMARTATGNTITPQASEAPAVVKTNRMPNQSNSTLPIGPRMPKMTSSSHPVTTGGSTSGK